MNTIQKKSHLRKALLIAAGSLVLVTLVVFASIEIRQRQEFRGEADCDPKCEPCDKGFKDRDFYDTQIEGGAYYGECSPGTYYCEGKYNSGCYPNRRGCLRGDDCQQIVDKSCCNPQPPGPTSTPAPRVCQDTICIPSPTPTSTPTPTAIPTSTPTPTNTPTPTATPTPVPLPCCADIVFLIDRSNSVLHFIDQQNALINNVLSKITSTNSRDHSLDVRVTIVSFGNTTRDDKVDWDYNFDSAVDATNNTKGLGGTCIECALDRAEQLLHELDNAPPREVTDVCKEGEVHKVLVLLTDGQPTVGRGGVAANEFCASGFIRGNSIEEINRLIQECITKLENKLTQPGETLDRIQNMVDKTIVLGIGHDISTPPPHPTPTFRPGYGINSNYLEQVASPEGYFPAESFSAMLRDEQQKDQLAQEICYFAFDDPDTPPPPRTSHVQCSANVQQINEDTVEIACQVDSNSNFNNLAQASFYITKTGSSEEFIGSKTCQAGNTAECLKTTYKFTDNQCFEVKCKLDYN
jgi:hypothetical protein